MNTRPKSPYIATSLNPYHVSVGGVIVNDEGKILTHYFDTFDFKSSGVATGIASNFYTLLRESLEKDELLEECLKRGAMEEFGATIKIDRYIGSLISGFMTKGSVKVQKTTLYFLCSILSLDQSLREEGMDEFKSELRWMDKNELIEKMIKQGKRIGRDDLDESEILKRI